METEPKTRFKKGPLQKFHLFFQPTEVIPHISNSSSENSIQGVDGKEVYTSDRELLLDNDSQVQMSRPSSSCCKNDFLSLSRLWALMVKNVIRIMRNPG